MQNVPITNVRSEPEFAAFVSALVANPERHGQLTELLREDHPLYDQRGTATLSRMRGWVLLALARTGVSDAALPFVLEELDTGIDPYLVATAACALRSYPNPSATFAPFIMRAITNIRYQDDPVSFQNYGEYGISSTSTSPVRELLITLAWLGPHAQGVLPEIEALRQSAISNKLLIEVDRAIEAIRSTPPPDIINKPCCTPPSSLSHSISLPPDSRCDDASIETTVFEDHEGASITFKEFFLGHPSIVCFFYTRCNNPLKCSLTITKLAQVQQLLEERGAADRIHTAAITYDPAFDLPERMRIYGLNRGLRLNVHHRMLRTIGDFNVLRSHFKLGVNFIGSVVNRHQIEAYALDTKGRIAASFERIHWDEQELVDCVINVLNESSKDTGSCCQKRQGR